MATRTVLTDAYNWTTPLEGVPGRWEHHTARRGDEIEVSDEEAKRGESLNALGSSADLATADAAAAAGWAPATDEDLTAMTVPEVHAYLNQVPEDRHRDEVERVLALEQERDKPRDGVLSLGDEQPAAAVAVDLYDATTAEVNDLLAWDLNRSTIPTPEAVEDWLTVGAAQLNAQLGDITTLTNADAYEARAKQVVVLYGAAMAEDAHYPERAVDRGEGSYGALLWKWYANQLASLVADVEEERDSLAPGARRGGSSVSAPDTYFTSTMGLQTVPVNLRFAFQGDEQVNRTLEAIENRGQDAIPLWEELANRFLDLEERQFDSEGAYASGGWEPLSPPYAAWKLDHYPGTHILERTGDLKASLTDGPGVRVLTSRAMWIGSDVDYGQFHQRGDGVPQRRPVELPEDERELWVRLTHRYLVTGEVGP